MKKLVLFLSFSLLVLIAHSGKPLIELTVYLEDSKDGETMAFQKTNKQGHTAFSKLGKGTYNIVVTLPKQSGKYAPKGDRKQRNYSIAYHPKKKSYFLQNRTGYYVITYSGLKSIAGSNISPFYEEKGMKNNLKKYILGKFEIKGRQGAVTMKLESFTEKEFDKKLKKEKQDPELMFISGKQTYSSDNKKIE